MGLRFIVDNPAPALLADLVALGHRHGVPMEDCRPRDEKMGVGCEEENSVHPDDAGTDRGWPRDDETNIEFYADQLAQAVVAEVDDVDLLEAVTGEFSCGGDDDSVFVDIDDVPFEVSNTLHEAFRELNRRIQKRLARRLRAADARECKQSA